jgi:hypothetical protein
MEPMWWKEYVEFVFADNVEAAKELLLREIPKDKLVYKYYRGTNRDWKTLTKPGLWLSQAGRFNDPFDCAFLVNCHSKDVYDRKTEYKLAVKESLEQFEQDKKSKKMQESVFVSCFADRPNSMLMWSHYGAEHRGLCVGYNLYNLIERYDCFPVVYSRTMPKTENADINIPNSLLKYILTKNDEWSYEHEWRIVKINKDMEGENGILEEFEKPTVIYMGKRQKDSEHLNGEMFKEIRIKNPKINAMEAYQSDDFYVDINAIIQYKKKEKIRLFDFDLSRDKFELYTREYKI